MVAASLPLIRSQLLSSYSEAGDIPVLGTMAYRKGIKVTAQDAELMKMDAATFGLCQNEHPGAAKRAQLADS